MTDIETLRTTGDYRVRLIGDDYPDAPYDEGSSPILSLEYRHGYSAAQVTDTTNYVIAPELVDALERTGSDRRLFTRYARAFHGATVVQWHDSRDGTAYVTLDPADWRESVGAPAGSVSMTEWESYLEGAVYGYVVERRTVWAPVDADDDDDRTRTTWEHIDSCYGYYGDTDYLRASALQALQDATP